MQFGGFEDAFINALRGIASNGADAIGNIMPRFCI
ncbi:unknown (plasmid) [Haloarcula marismortui ATCC 43049]|uniref:Uncharacterized protein n=1 Tax=Haloarcula marismortui (strain ATCC 43049 / DSM 3752 / JCM 8966 / VKM B-1809) TaxID=272569 RepID=Q5V823_HALMA|nr:unknown [Haloarcula marismortui ATCC 43049]